MFRIACEDDFGAFACAGQNGLDFVGGEVLGLVHDKELLGKRAASNVSQRLNLEQPMFDQFFMAPPPVTGLIGGVACAKNQVEVVVERLHPRREFFVHIAG